MSTRQAEKPTVLLDQQLALRAYFDALLTPPDPGTVEAAPAEVPSGDEAGGAVPEAVGQGLVVATGEEVLRDLPVPYDPAAQIPSWGQERFEALTFSVAGLTLAVPLARLAGVSPWREAPTSMPNRAPWFLGLVRDQETNVRVVDTAQLVLPASRRDGLAPAAERATHLVLVDEGRWGLACDEIGDVSTLEPEDVSWRTARCKRPWLAGTVRAQLCAVLDPDAFAEVLKAGTVK